jgi:hypothetical protein
MRSAQNREFFEPRRQGNRPTNTRAGPLGRIHDFAGRLIEDAVIERL